MTTFAHCAGRLSATMEFQWLIGEDAEQTAAERTAMLALLETVSPPNDKRRVLALRIEAKAAQARLLTRAYFSEDPVEARWATDRAEIEIGQCRALILG